MADFEDRREEIEEAGATIVAASSDFREGAWKAIEEWGLGYPVVHGLDPERTSELIGCHTGEHDGEPHIQPAAFVLDEGGEVLLGMCSTGRVGRLTPDDALDLIG